VNSKIDRSKIEALAEKYIKRGKLLEAIAEYKKLLLQDEEDISVRNIIGDLYIKANQEDKAVEEFQKIASHYEEKGLSSKAIAIYKRISRLNPDDTDAVNRLAELYRNKGFISEAVTEYSKLAKKLRKSKKTKEIIRVYEELIKLNKNDFQSRLALADIYIEIESIDQAIEELNKVAEFKIRNNELKEAGKILNQAKTLKEDNPRTLENLIVLLKKENKRKEALYLVEEILKKDKDNLKVLYLLGNLHFEDKSLKEAEEIFLRIISIRPKEVEARVKLGKIYIQENHLDKAFELYEPLVDALMKKQKSDKAVGLLGLILASKEAHLPTLNKLASIFQTRNQLKNLELVCNVIFGEYRKNNLREKMLYVLAKLVNISPENEEYYLEYRKMKKELGILEEGISGIGDSSIQLGDIKDIVETGITKADLYIEQGLIRNAKRILENLRIRFPEELRIESKIEDLANVLSTIKTEEIPKRVERVSERETQLFGRTTDLSQNGLPSDLKEEPGEEKLTAADIFAETDIIPLVSQESGEKSYFDLTKKIEEELDAIKTSFNYQLRGDTTIVEKALSDIVSEFRKTLEEKVDKEDYESHYNLGIAFLEQGLLDEAIEECKLALGDKKLEIECFSVISFCHRKKKDFKEALKWIEDAQKLSEDNLPQSFALKYEEASIYEEMEDDQKALKMYNEIKKWNPEYRDVANKIKNLEKNP